MTLGLLQVEYNSFTETKGKKRSRSGDERPTKRSCAFKPVESDIMADLYAKMEKLDLAEKAVLAKGKEVRVCLKGDTDRYLCMNTCRMTMSVKR